MANEKETFSKVFGDALNKSMEVNKAFLDEGSRFIRQLGNKDAVNRFSLLKGENISNAFSQYLKLNLDHFNNLVDLSLNLIREANNTTPKEDEPVKPGEPPAGPSFLLERDTEAGNKADFQFLLDNVKEETANCEFVHTGFSNDSGLVADLKTTFDPAVFELKAGETRSISISIFVPQGTSVGVYSTRVLVKGYVPAYFSIRITVTQTKTQTPPDAGIKEKTKRN